MKKKLRRPIAFILLFCFLFSQINILFAIDSVDISIYYTKIEEVIDTSKTDVDKISLGDGEEIVESYYSPGYAYKIKKVKISSEKELIDAMGGGPKFMLKYGQKCLLEAYRAATSEEIKSRAEASYKPELTIDLIDTSNDGKMFGEGYNTKSGAVPNIMRDFWPCSWGSLNKIQISDVEGKYRQFKNPSGKVAAYSTVFHEYAHFMDNTDRGSDTYRYGLDGVHYGNEITSERMAFIEGWAEYNEMIENKKVAKNYKEYLDSLIIESETIGGDYTYVKPEDCDFQTLVKSECYNAYLLYRLSQEIGEDKITAAFVESRWDYDRDMNVFVSCLAKLYPEDTETICKVIDEVFMGKAEKEDLYKMVGETDATKAYIEKREGNSNKLDETIQFIKTKTDELTQGLVEIGKEEVNRRKERNEKIKEIFTNVVDTVKDKITELAENDKEKREALKTKLSEFFSNIGSKLSAPVKNNSIFQKFLNMFKKMLGIETDEVEDTEETEDESVEGIAIENTNISNEDLENSNENIEVEGSSNNPFDE